MPDPGACTALRLFIGTAAVVTLAAMAYGLTYWLGLVALVSNEHALHHTVEELGAWGPAALIGLEALAIVVTPIPSGPIAMVAGAAYGPIWGTIYTATGAEIGAITAFLIARLIGYDLVVSWVTAKPIIEKLNQNRSQWWLMGIVLISRFLPFISFDAVSYAAGLTPLALWRFALATLVGVVPIAFALAYAGEEFIGADSSTATIILSLLGVATFGSFLLHILRSKSSGRPRKKS